MTAVIHLRRKGTITLSSKRMILPNISISRSPDQTQFIASDIARSLVAGSVLKLVGDLGAGKTEFVKGLATGLNCNKAVTSPTFTLVHEYLVCRLLLEKKKNYPLNEVI